MKNWEISGFFKTNVNSKESVSSKDKKNMLKVKYIAVSF